MDRYHYKVSVYYYDDNKKKSILIRSDKVKRIAIDYDYDNNNMPVTMFMLSLDRNFIDHMIKYSAKNRLILDISEKCATNGDDTWSPYIQKVVFRYFIKEHYNRFLDYQGPDAERDDLLNVISIMALPESSLVNNKKINNTMIYDTDMSTIVGNYILPLGKTLMEPLSNNKHISQVLLPKDISTIKESLRYFNKDVCAFYETYFRFFIDFDQSYLISSSGKSIANKGDTCNSVYIDIREVLNFSPDDEAGMKLQKKYNRWYVPTGIYRLNTSDGLYNIQSNNISILTGIDADGNRVDYDVDITGHGNKLSNKVIEVENNNLLYVKNLASKYRSTASSVTFSKNDLESSVFTINKEYMFRFQNNNDGKSGRYLLRRKRDYYMNQNNEFRLSTTLTFSKVDLAK